MVRRTVAGAQSRGEKEAVVYEEQQEAVACEEQQAGRGGRAPGGHRGRNTSGFVEDAGVCVCV